MYAGDFAGASYPVPGNSVVATPSAVDEVRELVGLQEPIIARIAPRLHAVLYGPGGVDQVLIDGQPAAMAKLLSYAIAQGKSEPNNETMV